MSEGKKEEGNGKVCFFRPERGHLRGRKHRGGKALASLGEERQKRTMRQRAS